MKMLSSEQQQVWDILKGHYVDVCVVIDNADKIQPVIGIGPVSSIKEEWISFRQKEESSTTRYFFKHKPKEDIILRIRKRGYLAQEYVLNILANPTKLTYTIRPIMAEEAVYVSSD
jgi:NAD(P)H-flavin reductase